MSLLDMILKGFLLLIGINFAIAVTIVFVVALKDFIDEHRKGKRDD